MFHYNYEDHVMPFFEVIMMGKSGALYKAVFQKPINAVCICGHLLCAKCKMYLMTLING